MGVGFARSGCRTSAVKVYGGGRRIQNQCSWFLKINFFVNEMFRLLICTENDISKRLYLRKIQIIFYECNRQLTHRATAKHPAEHWVWPGASLSGQRLLM